MENHFTHLHLHTDYSLLDGAITIPKLINFAKENKLKAAAITDHGNIFGAVKFFQQAEKAGIKPVLGIEAYLAGEDARIKDPANKYWHLILLVQNETGYKNLCRLIAYSYQEGFYFKPRIDYRMLEKYGEGLIALSGCLGGHIPQLLMQEKHDEATKRIDWFLKHFGEERFYFEIQPEDQPEQKILNSKLFDLAERKGVGLVATGDCHYVSRNDREAHEIMLAISTHHKLSDPGRFTFGSVRAYMRTTQEMLELWPGREEAIWQAGRIADLCHFGFKTGTLFFPQFPLPKDHTEESYFEQLAHDGLAELIQSGRIATDEVSLYRERLAEELALIIKMGFVGYFLVVSDFIQWAHTQKIPVGPGRGSVAGSLVAWALRITNIDPLKYTLLFERFLNPERVSMPDIDIDFCVEGRETVINYVRDKYGHENVSQIITFGTMMAKGVIKDVARVLGFPFEDATAITDLVGDQLKITLQQALEQNLQLQELVEGNPRVAHLFDIAKRLEGVTRHASKHAAGIVISPEPIASVLPVYIPPKSHELVSQYAMFELEYLGFLKMDFLGLKNLTLIKRAVSLISKNHNISIDIQRIPLDDAQTFTLLQKGDTSGVFQLESGGLKEVLRRLKPAVFEDVIAVNALYRPGPLGSGMVDDFIERKHGRQEITYLFDELEPILCDTYGVIVYQEQVMKIASTIAGYSLGEADILRRAMGKKKVDVMAAQREKFVKQAEEKGFSHTKAGKLFDLMAYFAGYGFNKSHSAAYALIAYQTAYLKAHYPAEFMAAVISAETHDAEKMAFYISEAKHLGLIIVPPDINSSVTNFVGKEDSIQFGLHGIKSVGAAALEMILQERDKKPFQDLLDFAKRVDLRTANKRVIENLVQAGAFDSLPGNRAQKFQEVPRIIELAVQHKKAEKTGQMDLFGIAKKAVPEGTVSAEVDYYSFAPLQDWPDQEKLEREKAVLGIYVSAQPLDQYQRQLKWLAAHPFAALEQASNGDIVRCCGTLKSHKVITTKRGDRMAFVTLDDGTSTVEVILFPKVFSVVEPWLSEHHVFVVRGARDAADRGRIKIKAQVCIPIGLIYEQWAAKKLVLTLPDPWSSDTLEALKEKIIPGSTPLEFHYHENKHSLKLAAKTKIRPEENFLKQCEEAGIDITIEI